MADSDPSELAKTIDESALAKTLQVSDFGQAAVTARDAVRDAAYGAPKDDKTQPDPPSGSPFPTGSPPVSDPGPQRSTSAPGRDTQLPRIGRYVLLRALGEGGMGVVYAAYDEELDRKVAVKIIHPSRQSDSALRTRIQREAQALARLSTPNVVTVYQVGEVDGQLYIAMEFVNGTTLSKWQVEPGRTWQDILRMYIAAGQGLLAAHQAGLVHRDFKPDNVLIGKDLRPRVADFGLARMEVKGTGGFAVSAPLPAISMARAEKALLSPVTQAGVVMGTPLYMSPEQHLGDVTDSRSDQFSFCVALYEALYGKLPFAGNTMETLAYSTISGKVQPRPAGSHVPAIVHEALLRGLAPSPGQRFPSMRELLAALSYDPAVDLAAGPKERKRVLISMIAVILIVALGMNVMQRLGVEAMMASLYTCGAFFAVFVFMAIRFRRAMRNSFHRGMLVYGLVFTGQILAFRIIGFWLKLTFAQLVTLDLIALAAMNCVAATLVMSSLWPVVPLAMLSALLAAIYPDYAPTLSSGLIVLQIIMSMLLWNRAAGARSPRRRRKSESTDSLMLSD